MQRVHSFPPIAKADARVLILGSMPGVASLGAVRYYAHPRNAFWAIMGALVGARPELPYDQRLERLMDAGIAVWDVLESAEREGSLDTAIQHAVPNDVPALLERCPQITLIATNGTYATATFKRLLWKPCLAVRPDLRHVALPSTSPANARSNLDAKLEVWRATLEPALTGA